MRILETMDFGEAFYRSFNLLYRWWPLWLPIFLFAIFFDFWIRYTRTNFIIKQGSVLLEIKMPKLITKSPLAMEIILTALYQSSAGNYIEAFLGGKLRPWFSLEIVSIDGVLHFYIWTPAKFKNLVEAQIYAQYPEVEIYEVEDYTKNFFYDPSKSSIWGTHFVLTGADPLPIKTYVDYGLDKEQEEEYKIDPMTSVLEYMGSLKKGEQVWIQIMIQAHRSEKLIDLRFRKTDDIKKRADAELKKIRKSLESATGYPRIPSKGEAEKMAAIERSKDKWPFDCGIRGFYIATKEAFSPINITGLIGSMRQYSSNDLNGFKFKKWTDFDYPWQDFKRRRRTALEYKFLDAYKRRSFFNTPYKYFRVPPFVLTVEELATIYHFPGGVATTPGIIRIPSKKAQAPGNLPI